MLAILFLGKDDVYVMPIRGRGALRMIRNGEVRISWFVKGGPLTECSVCGERDEVMFFVEARAYDEYDTTITMVLCRGCTSMIAEHVAVACI